MTGNPESLVDFHISGKTYSACFDPKATDLPKDLGLPEPSWKKVGKGRQCHYHQVPLETLKQAVENAENVGLTFVGLDPDSRAEGRAILKDVDQLTELIDRLDGVAVS